MVGRRGSPIELHPVSASSHRFALDSRRRVLRGGRDAPRLVRRRALRQRPRQRSHPQERGRKGAQVVRPLLRPHAAPHRTVLWNSRPLKGSRRGLPRGHDLPRSRRARAPLARLATLRR